MLVNHLQALELSQEILDQREVIHVDIAYDELSSGEYREDLVSQLLLLSLAFSDIYVYIHCIEKLEWSGDNATTILFMEGVEGLHTLMFSSA